LVVSVVVVELWVSLVWVPLFIVLVVVAVEVVAGLSMFLHIGGLCECCQDLGREISDAKKTKHPRGPDARHPGEGDDVTAFACDQHLATMRRCLVGWL
jgi:hypothetical protein